MPWRDRRKAQNVIAILAERKGSRAIESALTLQTQFRFQKRQISGFGVQDRLDSGRPNCGFQRAARTAAGHSQQACVIAGARCLAAEVHRVRNLPHATSLMRSSAHRPALPFGVHRVKSEIQECSAGYCEQDVNPEWSHVWLGDVFQSRPYESNQLHKHGTYDRAPSGPEGSLQDNPERDALRNLMD
jgi:hypothetical protein